MLFQKLTYPLLVMLVSSHFEVMMIHLISDFIKLLKHDPQSFTQYIQVTLKKVVDQIKLHLKTMTVQYYCYITMITMITGHISGIQATIKHNVCN